MYAVIGPFSNGQSQSLETLELDDRVEYAKINYNLMVQNSLPDSDSSVEEEIKFNADGKWDTVEPLY